MLLPTLLQLRALTHPGLVRSTNQDAHAIHPEWGLALLADGMGGGRAGEVASALAVQEIQHALRPAMSRQAAASLANAAPAGSEAELLDSEQRLRMAVSRANAVVHARSTADPACRGMGTTVLLALRQGPVLLLGHVGDSRAYILRPTTIRLPQMVCRRLDLQALTRDHSTVQAAADVRVAMGIGSRSGADTAPVPRLTRALGVEPEVVLELHRHRVEPGDLILLCSDGLTDMLSDARIETLLNQCCAQGPSPATEDELESAVQGLLSAALQAGGVDNITVVLGQIPEAGS